MRILIEFLLPPVLFGGLAMLAARLGRYAVIVLAIGWVAALGTYFLATAPGPEAPLHDFERTPLPAILATVAGTAAATAFLVRQKGKLPPRVTALATIGAYQAVAIPVYIVVLLLRML